MAKCSLKCTADGVHEAWGPNGRVGEADEDELRQYAKTHLNMKDGEGDRVGTASAQLHSLVMATVKSQGVNERQALDVVVATAQGRELWEQKRLDELAEQRVLRAWKQKESDELTQASVQR